VLQTTPRPQGTNLQARCPILPPRTDPRQADRKGKRAASPTRLRDAISKPADDNSSAGGGHPAQAARPLTPAEAEDQARQVKARAAELARREALIARAHRLRADDEPVDDARAALVATIAKSSLIHGYEFDPAKIGFREQEIQAAELARLVEDAAAVSCAAVEVPIALEPADDPKGSRDVIGEPKPEPRAVRAARRAGAVARRQDGRRLRELSRESLAHPDRAVALHIEALQLEDAAADAPPADLEPAIGREEPGKRRGVSKQQTRRRDGASLALHLSSKPHRSAAHSGRREQYQTAAARLEAKEHRRQQAWAAKCAAEHDGKRPPYIPIDMWRMGREVGCDAVGRSCRWWIARSARVHGPAAVALVVRAALAIDDDGTALYAWHDARARHVLAAGLFMLWMSRRVRKQRQPWRAHMRDAKLVRGISRATVAALLQDPNSKRRPSNTAMTGYWRTGDVYRGEVGYLRALSDVGAIYKHQLPPDARCIESWEIGRSGYCMNRYWVGTQFAREVGEALALGQWLEQLLDGQHLASRRRRTAAEQPAPPN
jgi:hypothetical protein